ncbi:Clr5 domain-containing protein [Geopyxis carbonaria]|nr:Clr5 domain-containing protein [Geopyxis carbonaria]
MPCTPRTPATVWESHKEEIRQLYLAEDKGLPSVMEHMKTSYGLAASKNEYQRIFNQWGFRKNLTQKEWAFVNHRTQKRKAEDATKETQVTFHGVRQDPKRVKRELNRHFPWPEQQPTGVPSPKTPAGILVGTPAALIGTPAELYVGISLSPVSPTELISIWDNGGGTNSPNVSPVSPTELISIWDNGGGTNSPNVIDAVVKKDDFWYPFDVYQEPEIQLSNEIKPLR